MREKMVQIGARIPQEDAEFIARLKIEGAVTPSEKVRAIIAEARRRQLGAYDYEASLALMGELLAPVLLQVRQLELKNQVHSELVTRILERLQEILAVALSSHGALGDKADAEALALFERQLADRVFRLMESILQLGVTRHCPCYDAGTVFGHFTPILALARIIDRVQSPQTEEGRT